MAEVTLYHWEPNANSGKPMLALMEKGVAFDSHYIDMLNFDQHSPAYLEINPQGTIPAMTHRGPWGSRVLVESTAIMEYVNDAFDGPALMPADARDCWRIRWWRNGWRAPRRRHARSAGRPAPPGRDAPPSHGGLKPRAVVGRGSPCHAAPPGENTAMIQTGRDRG